MRALAVVEVQIAIQILLELSDALKECVAKRRGEELFLDGAVEAFAEAVGLRRVDLGAAMLNLVDGQVQLEVVLELAAAELSSVIGEQVLDRGGVFLIEGKPRSSSTSTAVMGTFDRYTLAKPSEQ